MANEVNRALSEQFIVNVIKRTNPSYDLNPLSPFYDLFVRFFAETDLPEILNLLTQAKENRSLVQTTVTQDSFDQLLANWFFERDSGDYTTFVARFIFSTNSNVVSVKRNDLFKVAGFSFFPIAPMSFNPSSFKPLNSSEFYIEIPMIASTKGSGQVVVVGDSIIDPPFLGRPNVNGFLRGLVYSDVSVGRDPETNASALQRLQKEVSVQNLINVRSVNAQLSKKFPGVISDIKVVGFQDPEMFRDKIAVQLPVNKVVLTASQPFSFQLQKNQYRFLFMRDPSIIYRIKEPSISKQVGDWELIPATGLYETWVEVQIESISNPLGFQSDLPIDIFKDPSSIPFSSLYPLFKGARSKEELSFSTDIHVGGFTDLYVKPPVYKTTILLTVPSTPSTPIEFPSIYKPILSVEEVRKADSSKQVINGWALVGADPTLRFSATDPVKILIAESLAGTQVEVDITYSPLVKDVDSYVMDPYLKISASNTLTKFFNPVFLSFFISAEVTGDLSFAESTLRAIIRNEVENLKSGGVISINNIMASLYSQYPRLSNIISVNVFCTQELPNGTRTTLVGKDIIEIEENLSLGVSKNTCTFIFRDASFEFV